jgi:hypothetical protein
MLQIVWGPAPGVWWVPVIELVETRAEYFSAVCPMMFFFGLPGVLPRMAAEAGLVLTDSVTLDSTMAFADVDEAVEVAIHGGPLAGLYRHRLDEDAQAEVRTAHRPHRGRVEPVPRGDHGSRGGDDHRGGAPGVSDDTATPLWVRAVADPAFREALIADPLRALAGEPAVAASPGQVRQLEEMDAEERGEFVRGVVREVHMRGGQARFGAVGEDGRLGGPPPD